MEATLTLPDTIPLYTPDDLVLLGDEPRYELLDGRLVEKKMGAKSDRVAVQLITHVEHFLKAHPLGFTFGGGSGYRMFPERPNRVRFPDGSFIRAGRLPTDEVPDGYILLAPDLALEVVSPNDEAYEVEDKIEEYLEAGVQLIWVAYPRTKRVMVFRADGSVARLKETDQLSGELLLPGFSCLGAELFR